MDTDEGQMRKVWEQLLDRDGQQGPEELAWAIYDSPSGVGNFRRLSNKAEVLAAYSTSEDDDDGLATWKVTAATSTLLIQGCATGAPRRPGPERSGPQLPNVTATAQRIAKHPAISRHRRSRTQPAPPGPERAYKIIDAAEITRSMSPIGDTPLPTNEGQARELGGLQPETAAE